MSANLTNRNDRVISDSNLCSIGGAVKIDERQIQGHLDELVRGTVEETINKLLDAEAVSLLPDLSVQQSVSPLHDADEQSQGESHVAPDVAPKPVRDRQKGATADNLPGEASKKNDGAALDATSCPDKRKDSRSTVDNESSEWAILGSNQ